MINFDEMTKQLNSAVKDAVRTEAHRLQGTVAKNELVASTLKKPMITFPEDVSIVLGTGRTTTFSIVSSDKTFPPMATVGRRRFVNTAKFMIWLESKSDAS